MPHKCAHSLSLAFFCSAEAKKAAKETSGEPKLSADLKSKLTASISKIIAATDLEKLSVKSVREQLATEHGAAVNASPKAVKDLITEAVQSKSE